MRFILLCSDIPRVHAHDNPGKTATHVTRVLVEGMSTVLLPREEDVRTA